MSAALQEPAARFIGPGAWRHGVRYGLLGLPLAFVALPLYVILPNHYAREFGAPLALLGAVLLAARLVDAVLDPWIGRWCDRLSARPAQQRWCSRWDCGACCFRQRPYGRLAPRHCSRGQAC
jgi:hypothetical protein